jgi:tripartite-type tricarboxylate transporter receptor subunit TctC
VSTVSIVVTANPKSGMNSMQDLLARAKAQPGKLNAGTGGQAGPGHLALELLRTMAGVDIVHVPFKGGAAATTALLGEQVDVVIDGSAMGQVKGGKLKAIAVTGPRLPALPDVPGIGETVKGYEFTNWWGILAPAGTPAAAIDRLNQELAAIAAMPDVRAKLADLGLAAKSSTPQQFADLIRTETDKVAKIVKDAGIKFE